MKRYEDDRERKISKLYLLLPLSILDILSRHKVANKTKTKNIGTEFSGIKFRF